MPSHEEVKASVRECLQKGCAKQTLVFLSLAVCVDYESICNSQVPWGIPSTDMCVGMDMHTANVGMTFKGAGPKPVCIYKEMISDKG